MLALPAAVALAILALPLVSTLYQYGRFGAADALATRTALIGYGIGLPGLVAIKILAPAFYARGDLATPVRIAAATVAIALTLAFILMWVLGHAGLTVATSRRRALQRDRAARAAPPPRRLRAPARLVAFPRPRRARDRVDGGGARARRRARTPGG